MPKQPALQPLSPLETELVDLLRRYDTDEKLMQDYLVRMRAVIALQEVSKILARPLNRDERKRAHVQFMDGRTVDEIVALLSKVRSQ